MSITETEFDYTTKMMDTNTTFNPLLFLEHFFSNISNGSAVPDDVYHVPTGIVALLAFLYGSISLTAVIGNGLVIFVIAKDKRMQTVTNIFIANLALADVVIGMFTTPFQFQPALHQRWDLPHFLCNIAPSVKVLSVSVSVLTLTVISVDRYVAVMYPLNAGFSKRYAVLGLLLIWIIGIASSFPEGLYHEVVHVFDININDFKPFCITSWPTKNFGKYYHLYLMLVQYLCPLLAINFTYARIACRIWGTQAPGNPIERDHVRQRNKKKVVKMLIIVVLLFVLCWLPLQVYDLISEIYPHINGYKYIKVIWFFSNWLAMSNSCYNPFIYGLLNEKFKREYRLLFRKSKCHKKKSLERANTYTTNNETSDETNNTKRMALTYRGFAPKRPITKVIHNGYHMPMYPRTNDRQNVEETSQTLV